MTSEKVLVGTGACLDRQTNKQNSNKVQGDKGILAEEDPTS